jgi:putative DNA primase/helicase
VTLIDFLYRLEYVYRNGPRGFMARCPAHPDRTPSLSIREGDDGRILVYCHAGCSTKSVLDTMRLTFRDLFPDGQATSRAFGRTATCRLACRVARNGTASARPSP